jgi:hypothetical protein
VDGAGDDEEEAEDDDDVEEPGTPWADADVADTDDAEGAGAEGDAADTGAGDEADPAAPAVAPAAVVPPAAAADPVAAVADSQTLSLSRNMWHVPFSLVQASMLDPTLKARQWMSALSAPRRSSWRRSPVAVSYTRIRVPFSLAVARRVPAPLRARHARAASCAAMSVVFRWSYSSTRTWPFCTPGQARTLWVGEGLTAQRPLGLSAVSTWSTRVRSAKL